MATYYLAEATVQGLFQVRQRESLLAPVETSGLPWLSGVDGQPSLQGLRASRAAQSAKGFLLPAAGSVGRYGATTAVAEAPQTAQAVIVGIRGCELRALEYLDKVLLKGPFEDPVYRQRRQATVLVSCDCATCAETCFCTLVGGQPFATGGYDVNLTPLDGGWVVDVATELGRQWLGEALAAAQPASPDHLARRDELRKATVRKLGQQNARFTLAGSDASPAPLPDDDAEAWQRFAADCVECGACTHICPTCYCFYLYDQTLGPETFERVRTWDSCLLSSYHRMAGGVNMKLTPRPRLRSRLANRVLHKFSYSPQQVGQLGCVGCGRCVEACLGAIDIRQVVQELRR